jgi:hypothetical protein
MDVVDIYRYVFNIIYHICKYCGFVVDISVYDM